MGSRGNRQVLMIPGVNTGSPNFIHMDGKEVFRFAVDVLPKCAKEVAAKAGISLDQVDRFVFHQANQRILDYAIKKLKIDPARCAGNIARHRQYLCRQRPPAAGRAGHIGGPALGPARSVRRASGAA